MILDVIQFVERALTVARTILERLRQFFRRIIDFARAFLGTLRDRLSGATAGDQKESTPPARTVASAGTSSATSGAVGAAPAIDKSDEHALARMLASEDRSVAAKTVIGWITVQKARAGKRTLYEVLTKNQGYGKQDRRDIGQGVMYASTAKDPSASDLDLARGLLSGSVQPSAAIRSKAPGGWVERNQGVSDADVVAKQTKWNEGIYARLKGTRWVLFSREAPILTIQQGQTASDLLDGLPEVPATDAPALAA